MKREELLAEIQRYCQRDHNERVALFAASPDGSRLTWESCEMAMWNKTNEELINFIRREAHHLPSEQAEKIRQAAPALLRGEKVDLDAMSMGFLLALMSFQREVIDDQPDPKEFTVALKTTETPRSPRVARFVLFLIPKKNREHLIGDLEEEYRTLIMPEYGRRWARIWYRGQVIQAVGFYVWPFVKRVLGMAAIWKVIGR